MWANTVEEEFLNLTQNTNNGQFQLTDGNLTRIEMRYPENYKEERYRHRIANLFFQVNESSNPEKKASNAEITGIRYLFIDFDFKLLDQQFATTEKFLQHLQENFFDKIGLYPTVTVFTGGGVHTYFKVANSDKGRISELAKIQKRLVKMAAPFGADESVCDISRILRIPNTYNSKYDSGYVRIINSFNFPKFYSERYETHNFDGKMAVYTIKEELPYATGKFDYYRTGVETDFTVEKFNELGFDIEDNESQINAEVVAISRESIKIDANLKLPDHDYFYQILEVSGQRHQSLLKYAAYLKQNYYSELEVLEIIDQLAITIENVGKPRKISAEEVSKIVKWIFGNKTYHNYVWSEKQKQLLVKVEEKINALASSDPFYLQCFNKMIAHIKTYGPSFFMSYQHFEEYFSKGTCQKLVKMLVENKILEIVESGGIIKQADSSMKRMANHYRLIGFRIGKRILHKIKCVMQEFHEEFKEYFRKLAGKFNAVSMLGMFYRKSNVVNYGQVPQRC